MASSIAALNENELLSAPGESLGALVKRDTGRFGILVMTAKKNHVMCNIIIYMCLGLSRIIIVLISIYVNMK